MTLLGMLHHRSDPRKVTKSYAFAAIAKLEKIDFVYFTPGSVNFAESTIMGKVYANGKWVNKRVRFPDVVYNASVPPTSKGMDIVEKLGKKIPFTSHSVGDKLFVYQQLKKGKTFSKHLLPSKVITQPNMVFDFLSKYKRVIIKPTFSHQGIGVIYLEHKDPKQYVVLEIKKRTIYGKDQLYHFIKDKISNQEFLIQPYIESKVKTGQSFDLRLHVQKNGEGKWTISSIYPRIGPMGSIITDYRNSAYTNDIDSFIKLEFGERHLKLKEKLQKFAIKLADHMDKIYGVSFDELGIDVGLDPKQRIWIYEVNWRPGAPPVFRYELDLVKNKIHYAQFLLRKKASQKTT